MAVEYNPGEVGGDPFVADAADPFVDEIDTGPQGGIDPFSIDDPSLPALSQQGTQQGSIAVSGRNTPAQRNSPVLVQAAALDTDDVVDPFAIDNPSQPVSPLHGSLAASMPGSVAVSARNSPTHPVAEAGAGRFIQTAPIITQRTPIKTIPAVTTYADSQPLPGAAESPPRKASGSPPRKASESPPPARTPGRLGITDQLNVKKLRGSPSSRPSSRATTPRDLAKAFDKDMQSDAGSVVEHPFSNIEEPQAYYRGDVVYMPSHDAETMFEKITHKWNQPHVGDKPDYLPDYDLVEQQLKKYDDPFLLLGWSSCTKRHTSDYPREHPHQADEFLPLVEKIPGWWYHEYSRSWIVPHGLGDMKFMSDRKTQERGDSANGNWVAGKLHGLVVYRFKNGDRYEGRFRLGIPDRDYFSDHVYWYWNGDRYQGEGPQAGHRNGKGSYWYANGSVYQGWFRNDKRDTCKEPEEDQLGVPVQVGRIGVMYFNGAGEDGLGTDVYEGEWQDGAMDGCGIFYFSNGKVEYGLYANGKQFGVSVRFSADRQRAWKLVDGNMTEVIGLPVAMSILERMPKWPGHKLWVKRNKKIAPGVPPTHPATARSVRSVRTGSKDAPSEADVGPEFDVEYLDKIRFQDGSTYLGETAGGKMEGKGTFDFASGNRYVGQYKAGKKVGLGAMYYVDGTVYEGEFRYDMKEGYGTLRYPDRECYDGEFAADRREGMGTYWYKDGAVLQSRFENGQPVGLGIWWSDDRRSAARLEDGQFCERQGITEATNLSERLGFPDLNSMYPMVTKGEGILEEDDARTVAEYLLNYNLSRSGPTSPPRVAEEDMPDLPPPGMYSPDELRTQPPSMRSGMVIFG